ncbi:UNKNOWN [Stylonychia lemnae]|uniref:Transmembrane protein n=1 Tax=Stylonychia lemnae TaxID=5949 RepID=A0A078BD86_STYLE|nr:UNKNOWN [Stylonychia lemnae]|eukprot:CDW91548.1 UNKNOWN [Stylonychia lemnae]
MLYWVITFSRDSYRSQVAYATLTFAFMNAISITFIYLTGYRYFYLEKSLTWPFIVSLVLQLLKDKESFLKNPIQVKGPMKMNSFSQYEFCTVSNAIIAQLDSIIIANGLVHALELETIRKILIKQSNIDFTFQVFQQSTNNDGLKILRQESTQTFKSRNMKHHKFISSNPFFEGTDIGVKSVTSTVAQNQKVDQSQTYTQTQSVQKKNVISRKNLVIEESRVFDNEEICNYDILAAQEKNRRKLSQFQAADSSKNQSIITMNYPPSLNGLVGNHTRMNSNPYGQSVIYNLNINSGRAGINSNRDYQSNLPGSSFIQANQIFQIDDDTKEQSPFWLKPDLKEAELVLQIDNKTSASQDLTTNVNVNTPNNQYSQKFAKNDKTATTAGNISVNNQKTLSSNAFTVASGANMIQNKDKNAVRRVNLKNFIPQSQFQLKEQKIIDFEINPRTSNNQNHKTQNLALLLQREFSQSNLSNTNNMVQFSEESQIDYKKVQNTQSRLKQKKSKKHLQSIDSLEENDHYLEGDSIQKNQIVDVFTLVDHQSIENINNIYTNNNNLNEGRNSDIELLKLTENNSQNMLINHSIELREQSSYSIQKNKLTLNITDSNLDDIKDNYKEYSQTSNKKIHKKMKTKHQDFQKNLKQSLDSLNNSSFRKKKIFSNDNDQVHESQSSIEMRKRKETIDDILMGDASQIYASRHTRQDQSIESRVSMDDYQVNQKFNFESSVTRKIFTTLNKKDRFMEPSIIDQSIQSSSLQTSKFVENKKNSRNRKRVNGPSFKSSLVRESKEHLVIQLNKQPESQDIH